MPSLDKNLEKIVQDIMERATQLYEGNPKQGVHEMPFLFVSSPSGEVVAHPVRIEFDQAVMEVSSRLSPGSQGQYLEQLCLQGVREKAESIHPLALLGVGYLFPANGDFPQTDQEVAVAHLLRSQGSGITPWTMEGIVFILDTPEGRDSWASLRDPGELADPLSSPSRIRVEASHVGRLYPHRGQNLIIWS